MCIYLHYISMHIRSPIQPNSARLWLIFKLVRFWYFRLILILFVRYIEQQFTTAHCLAFSQPVAARCCAVVHFILLTKYTQITNASPAFLWNI